MSDVCLAVMRQADKRQSTNRGGTRRGYALRWTGNAGGSVLDDESRVPENEFTAQEQREISHIEELLKKEEYTPEEAAEVLNMRQRTIFSAQVSSSSSL